MSDDLEHKIAWYYKSGWREIKEEYHRAATAYEDNPEWTQWIDDYRNLLGKWESKYNLTAEEVKDVKKIEGFPIPNKMKKDKAISKEARDFLIFIEDRFYKDFSQTSHLSWSSLAWQAPALLGTGVSEEEKESALKKIRSDCAFHATTLILMFFSEMELLLHFKYKEKLAYLWTFIAEYWGYAKELYDLRYQKQLNT